MSAPRKACRMFIENGFGRENGLEAIREYTQVKSVWVDLGAEVADPFPA